MKSRRRNFEFTPSYEQTVERAERQGSMYDDLFRGVKQFKAAEGRNIVRILPPTWDKPQHYGYPVWIHYGIGPREQAYLCLRENKSSPYKRCPICEELYKLGQKASVDDRKALMPSQSIIYYVLDRNQPQNGVMLWRVSATADSEIAAQSVNRRKGSVLNIVDPETGYDLEFLRSGQKLQTRYRGYQVVREDSPMTDDDRQFDEVVEFIFDKPLPSLLNFYKPEYIEQVYYGETAGDDTEGDGELKEEPPPPRSRARQPEPEEDEEVAEDEEAEEEPPPRRPAPRRASLREELDDEIPEPPPRRASPRRVAMENGEDDEPPPPRQPRRPPLRDDTADDRRARMRSRLSRQ